MSNSRNTAVAAFSAVDMLLQTSPTFVAKEVKPILALCVSVDSSGSEASENVEPVKSAANRVISTCTKKLPAPALYQAIQELFKEYAAARDPAASGIVSIFAQTIRQTNTRAVADMHKSLFGQLIIMLDVRSTLAAADKVSRAVAFHRRSELSLECLSSLSMKSRRQQLRRSCSSS